MIITICACGWRSRIAWLACLTPTALSDPPTLHVCQVWDYQARTCVQTLTDHTANVSCVAYHPDLPIIITGSEDGAVRLFHSNTYRCPLSLGFQGYELELGLKGLVPCFLLCEASSEGGGDAVDDEMMMRVNTGAGADADNDDDDDEIYSDRQPGQHAQLRDGSTLN